MPSKPKKHRSMAFSVLNDYLLVYIASYIRSKSNFFQL